MRVERSRLDGSTGRWRILGEDRELDFSAVVNGWAASAGFRSFWLASLGEAPLDAYCWECPAVTADSVSRPFECAFVASPGLARMPPDAQAFAGHFRTDCSVVSFANLGGDALLVAPCPGPPGSDYSHLASFTATAPCTQQDAFWKAVGEAMQRRLGTSPVWLSTAGHGIAWLHVRLDDRPKYYRHVSYAGR